MAIFERALARAGILGDRNLWSRDLERHSHGQFSFSVVRANKILQEFSEVHATEQSTFVGIYDGHGGYLAADFLARHVYERITELAREGGGVSPNVFTAALNQMETEFIDTVRDRFNNSNQEIAANGSCCLVGIIHQGRLWIANLGDSRAVLCKEEHGVVSAMYLTAEHNINNPTIRSEVRRLAHPLDRNVAVLFCGRYRIRGLVEVSRAIRDAYLKFPEFRITDRSSRHYQRVPMAITEPLITTEPEIITRNLEASDKFIIFASDGLWEHLSRLEAVEIVRANPRKGVAKELIKAVMRKGAWENGKEYFEIKRMKGARRRRFHDDITVVVLFIDHLEPNNRKPRVFSLHDNDRRYLVPPFRL